MARQKSKMIELPKGFTAISTGGNSWDFKSNPMIQGTIVSFREVASTKFFDGKGKNKTPKIQRVCTIKTSDGEVDVWESAALSALYDQRKGKKVCIIFRGMKRIKGRAQPMKDFQVGVA